MVASTSAAVPPIIRRPSIETDPSTLEQVAFGMRTLAAAESAGDLHVDGDHAAAERFLAMFPVAPTSTDGCLGDRIRRRNTHRLT